MKNLPLAVQIWLIFATVTLGIFLLLAIFLPWTLRIFFTQQVYDLLQDSQNNVFSQVNSLSSRLPEEILRGPVVIYPSKDRNRMEHGPRGPRIHHVFLSKDLKPEELDKEKRFAFLPLPFVKAVWKDAEKQQVKIQRYSHNIGDRALLYLIRKETIGGKHFYMISYSWTTYRNDLVKAMFWRLTVLMLFLILLSWLPAIWLARYLTQPLVQMGRQIERISQRDWHQPFILNRRDEIGRLAQAFEEMRQHLVRQDQAQQSFLQNVSHNLKTPIMVIRSYAQSIEDGIYPKGNLEGSIEVINSEAERLEKRVRNLLYLNKINYLKGRVLQLELFNLTEVIDKKVERIGWRRPQLSWQVELPPLFIQGDREQWEIVLENLLDNQIRYAHSEVRITLVQQELEAVIRLWNDGPSIAQEELANIFGRHYTGAGGEFGLGLAIVQQILAMHQAKIWVRNEDGVAFYIQIRS